VILRFVLCVAVTVGVCACDLAPGKPDPEHIWHPPSANLNFTELYEANCVGCHALESDNLAAARPMDPLYVRYAGAENLYRVTGNGVKRTTMPGFLDSEGGSLTSEQVKAIVDGLIEHSSKASIPDDLPPYKAELGDPAAGMKAHRDFCASCHGEDGNGGEKAGSIVDPYFLSLVTDQSLRSTIVAGRPDLGQPAYMDLVPGRVPTEKEISDIVAWLSAKRPANAQVLTAAKPVETAE
jgi:cytochrome c oxidase cbb3-type subunit 3